MIGNRRTREAICIDPGEQADDIMHMASEMGVEIKLIANSHAHLDHVLGVRGVQSGTDAEFMAAPGGSRHSPGRSRVRRPLRDAGGAAAGSGLFPSTTRRRSRPTVWHCTCCTRPVIRAVRSASMDTACCSPATRCSSRASAAPTCPAATTTRRCRRSCRQAAPASRRDDCPAGSHGPDHPRSRTDAEPVHPANPRPTWAGSGRAAVSGRSDLAELGPVHSSWRASKISARWMKARKITSSLS